MLISAPLLAQIRSLKPSHVTCSRLPGWSNYLDFPRKQICIRWPPALNLILSDSNKTSEALFCIIFQSQIWWKEQGRVVVYAEYIERRGGSRVTVSGVYLSGAAHHQSLPCPLIVIAIVVDINFITVMWHFVSNKHCSYTMVKVD